MADQTRLDRLHQGLGRLDAGGKLYIERLTSRLLQHNTPDHSSGPENRQFCGISKNPPEGEVPSSPNGKKAPGGPLVSALIP
jgi:hypothetical protein